jgi:hypothetical protein
MKSNIPLLKKALLTAAIGAVFAYLPAANAATYVFRIAHQDAKITTAPATTPAAGGSALVALPVTYSADSLNLGTAWVGSLGTSASLVISNPGMLSADIESLLVSSNSANFSQTNDCGSTISGGGFCTVLIKMNPAQAGVLSGEVSITSGSSTKSIALVGFGYAPTAALSTPTFAGTQEGTLGYANAVLTNTGQSPVTLTVPGSSSVTGARFSFAATTCTATLPVGAACSVTVQFGPVDSVLAVGELSFATNAGVLSAALSSTGLEGYATLSPASLNFTAQQIGTSSVSKRVTVTNTGTGTLNFSGVGISAGASIFGKSDNCANLAVNGTCAVDVLFTPLAAGSATGTLAFAHSGGGLASVALTGIGQQASAVLVAPTFTTVVTGSSLNATATLTNTGIGPLSLVAPGATAISGNSFSFVSTNCPAMVAAGTSCTVNVKFSPSDTTTASSIGSLTLSTGAGAKSVPLTGQAISNTADFQYFAGGLSRTFGTATYINSTSNEVFALTLINKGASAGSYIAPAFSGANPDDFLLSSRCTNIQPEATCMVFVYFTPKFSGTRVSSLQVGTKTADYTGSAVAVPADPYYLYVSALMHFDGNGADSTGKLSATANKITYAAGKFGSAGVFNGVDSYDLVEGSFNFSAATWTIEAWVKLKAYGGVVFGQYNASDAQYEFSLPSAKVLHFNGTSYTFSTDLPLDAWNHVAVVRNSGTTYAYVNGVRSSVTSTLAPMNLVQFRIGANRFGNYGIVRSVNGMIDEFRITSGIARYNGATVSVPVSEFANK